MLTGLCARLKAWLTADGFFDDPEVAYVPNALTERLLKRAAEIRAEKTTVRLEKTK